MHLKTLLIVGISLSLALVLGLAGGMVVMSKNFDEARQAQRFAEEIAIAALQLSGLTSDYLFNHQDRSRAQWLARHASLGSLLARGDGYLAGPDIDRLNDAYAKTAKLFERTVIAHAQTDAKQPTWSPRGRALANQLQTTMQAISSHGAKLSAEKHRLLAERRASARLMVVGFVMSLVLVITGLWIAIAVRVVAPIRRMSKELLSLAHDPDHRMSVTRSDEIGHLERSFNSLADRLQKTMVSSDLLTVEIDNRKSTEEELLRSETLLLNSQRLANIGSWQLDIESNELWWTEQTFDIFEIDAQATGASYEAFLERVHPDDRDLVDRTYTESVANHTPYELVHRILTPDGQIKYVLEHCKTVYDPSGKPLRSLGSVQDITERHKIQAALRESEHYLHSILENAAAIISLKDLDGRFIMINKLFTDMFDARAEDVLGHTDHDVFPEAFADESTANDHLVMETGIPVELDEQLNLADGPHYYLTVKFPLYNDDGKIHAVCGISTDITARKRAEELQQGQKHILELISRGNSPLAEIFEAIIQFSEGQYPEILGSILMLEDKRLRLGAAPGLPETYAEHVEGKEVGPESGSCSAAIYRGVRVIVADISKEPSWADDQPTAANFGYKACWSEPIVASTGEVLGTFALYRKHPGEPGVDEVSMIEAMAQLAAIAIERTHSEQRLARSGSEWTQAMDQFDDAVYLLDMQRHLLRANKAFFKMLGTTPEHCIGRHIVDVVHPHGEEEKCSLCLAQEAARETVITLEPDEPNNPSGLPIEATLKLMRDDGGEPSAMLMSLHDLSRSRQIEESLRLSASVFENTDEGVIITDAQANIVEVNRAFSDIMGYSREEVIGRKPSMWKSGRYGDSFYREMWEQLLLTGQWRGELWNRRKDGTEFPEWQTMSSVTDGDGNLTHYVSVFTDISHIKSSQEQLNHLAHHDALTDLPNRSMFNERLEQAIKHVDRNASQLAVVFLDLDQFKHINDSLGHPVGDQLLQEVANSLVHTVRQNDTVARIGGDEFVMLLEDVGRPENVAVMAQKLIATFASPFVLDEHEIHVTASMGICLCPQDGKDPASLLRNSDAAMYRAKEEGRNTFQFYTEELTRNAFERVLLENNLRQAIEKEQLYLVYQPQLEMRSQSLVGVEALLRWGHPELGTILPSRFIPLAEQCGLIRPIGEWVLNTACKQGAKWLRQGVDVGRIAVNVTGPQIQRGVLVDVVKKALDESGLSANQLEIEVTESFIMEEAELAIGQLNELRALGVTLAIDDFGTGYSSLSYLKQLPVHKLKIDQSFVRDIPVDPDDMAITDAVIAMGKSLGLIVIAEGVETPAQADFLHKAGCEEVQGFLYSRPLSPDELEQWLEVAESPNSEAGNSRRQST